jgi:hypothetical protein
MIDPSSGPFLFHVAPCTDSEIANLSAKWPASPFHEVSIALPAVPVAIPSLP